MTGKRVERGIHICAAMRVELVRSYGMRGCRPDSAQLHAFIFFERPVAKLGLIILYSDLILFIIVIKPNRATCANYPWAFDGGM